jgi:4-oxalocrotonate tautomerase
MLGFILQPNLQISDTMPYVNIQITQGATRAQKAQLVKEVTDSLANILGKQPEHTHIVIQEIADENWGFAGLLTDDWKQKQVHPDRKDL